MDEFNDWYDSTNPLNGTLSKDDYSDMLQERWDDAYGVDHLLIAAERGPVPYNWEAQYEMLRDDYLGLMDGYTTA